MALRIARDALSRMFYQRCFYLFVMLLVLITAVPFMPGSDEGRFLTNAINVFVIVSTVAAVGRTMLSFVIVLLLAGPMLLFQWIGLSNDSDLWLVRSWMFGAGLYLVSTVYLLQYVFRPEVMTADKLFGAAAGYLMLGVLWGYFYAIYGHFHPKSFMVLGEPATLDVYDAVYFSMTVLTSTGFGDITPLVRQARAICVVEQITGALFAAILIARLAGVYPPQGREVR